MKLLNEETGERFEFKPTKGCVPLGTLTPLTTGKRWRAEEGKWYWFLCSSGSVLKITDNSHSADAFRYSSGNYFQTEEQAIAYREYTLAKQRLKDYIREGNAKMGWVADWSDFDQKKWLVEYDQYEDCIVYSGACSLQARPKWRYGHPDVIRECMKDCADDWDLFFKYEE